MNQGAWSVITTVLFGCAAAGLSYTFLALWFVRRFRPSAPHPSAHPLPLQAFPPVSILQPLCGAEPRLYDTLKSFLAQDYPNAQIVWGVRDGNDPAIAVVKRLQKEFPHARATLVVDARIHGANLKVSNLQNILPSCQHDVLILADSDVLAPPDTVSKLVASLHQPGIGVVTTTYTGIAAGSLASHLGAMFINDWFIPSALVDLALNGSDGCYGPLTAIRRHVLEEIGGFETLSNYLAEDNRMGRLARERGWGLYVEPLPTPTVVNETRLLDLITHEVRWARTVRCCRPRDHILQVVTFPLPFVIALALLAPSPVSWSILALHLWARMALHVMVRTLIPNTGPLKLWAVPLREALCFLVWAISLWGDTIRWRNAEFRLTKGGRMVSLETSHLGEAVQIAQPNEIPAMVGDK